MIWPYALIMDATLKNDKDWSVSKCGMTAELKDSGTRFTMLLTSGSRARPSLMSHVPRGDFYIRWLGGLATKFASEIRVRAPNFATKNIGEKYPTLCPLNFRYDPKMCVEDLHEFSSALYSLVRFKVKSKQII